MIGLSLELGAHPWRGPCGWAPQGVAAALDFRRGLYALSDAPDVAGATETELQSLRPASFAEAITASRASAATYVDAQGLLQTAPADQPRFDWTHGLRQLLVERAATNLFSDPFNPASQTVAVNDADDYTISVRGAGSVTVSGAASGVATVGAALNVKTSGTSLTCVVSGSPEAVQVEHMHRNDLRPAEWGSSFIEGSRAADNLAFGPRIVDLYNRAECTVLIQLGYLVDHRYRKVLLHADEGAMIGYRRDSLSRNSVGPAPELSLAPTADTNEPKAIAGAWTGSEQAVAGWSGTDVTFGKQASAARVPTEALRLGYSESEVNMPIAWYDAVYVWPRRLSDAELQQVARPYGA